MYNYIRLLPQNIQSTAWYSNCDSCCVQGTKFTQVNLHEFKTLKSLPASFHWFSSSFSVHANVTPFFKKLSKMNVKNYPLVSILPKHSKIFERIMHHEMTLFLVKVMHFKKMFISNDWKSEEIFKSGNCRALSRFIDS